MSRYGDPLDCTYTVADELGWTLPNELLGFSFIESDETSSYVDYQLIEVEEFAKIAVQMHYGIVEDKYANTDWHLRTLELCKELSEDADVNTPEDLKEAIEVWANDINSNLEHRAEVNFEAQEDGSDNDDSDY
jgi:hypothetical protein